MTTRTTATPDMTTNEEPGFVGVIPAAGLGSRLGPMGYPKELLPIAFDGGGAALGMRPRPVMAYSLEGLERAGVRKSIIVISELKHEIMQVFGGGESHGQSLSYVVRSLPRGLADAVEAASPWLMGRNVCLTLPDTVIEPASAMRDVCADFRATGADVVLGVFPTPIPEQLGPVRFGEDGVVLEVLDKPKECAIKNTWAIAAWGPRFTQLLSESNRKAAGEASGPNLGEVFQSAVERGLDVRARYFPAGRFFDLGTSTGWGEFLRWSIQPAADEGRRGGAYAS